MKEKNWRMSGFKAEQMTSGAAYQVGLLLPNRERHHETRSVWDNFLPFLSDFSCASAAKDLPQNNIYPLARAPGGQMQGAATQAMPVCIVEERQRSRCPPAAAPLRAAARRPAGFVARSLQTKEYARRSRLASGPGGQQQSVNVIH